MSLVRCESPTPHDLVLAATSYPDAWIAWYDSRLEPWLAHPDSWPSLARHRLQILHLGCFQRTDLLTGSLGFVDFDAPGLLPGPAGGRFGTPLVSPAAGLIHASAILALEPDVRWTGLAGFLLDLGLRGVRHGLIPRSEPGLLRGPVPEEVWESLRPALPESDLVRLVRRVYGRKWVGFWLLARLLFDGRLPVLPVLRGWLAPAPGPVDGSALSDLHPPLPAEVEATVDVLIPTLGRPGPLQDVLDDLGRQSHPPRRVIVVDQGGSTPEPVGAWPFDLVFLSLPAPGACQARNAGLHEVRSDWVMMLDDDVRLRPGLIAYLLRVALAYDVEAVNAAVHLPGGTVSGSPLPFPWPAFASGASLVSSRVLAKVDGFDVCFEGGYGEDYEFGLRLRLAGAEILYAPGEPVLHLKAPVGGFRTRMKLPWSEDLVPPRPAPTVLYSRRKHHTEPMRNGYRLYYALRRLSRVPLLSRFREARDLSRQWKRAVWWADRIGGGP